MLLRHVAQNLLQVIPVNLFQFVKTLDLRANKITQIPSDINKLATLQVLLLTSNAVSIPSLSFFIMSSFHYLWSHFLYFVILIE